MSHRSHSSQAHDEASQAHDEAIASQRPFDSSKRPDVLHPKTKLENPKVSMETRNKPRFIQNLSIPQFVGVFRRLRICPVTQRRTQLRLSIDDPWMRLPSKPNRLTYTRRCPHKVCTCDETQPQDSLPRLSVAEGVSCARSTQTRSMSAARLRSRQPLLFSDLLSSVLRPTERRPATY